MQHADRILLAALRAAPRRYRMPPLPVLSELGDATPADTALAVAIEAARLGRPEAAGLFTRSLARVIRAAIADDGGDPAFQALVLRAHAAEVDEHVRLAAQAAADGRAVRMAVDAIAHPGKLGGMAAGADHDALASLHRQAAAGAWTQLRQAAGRLLDCTADDRQPLRAALSAIMASPSLVRLERREALQRLDAVLRYQALCEQRGPGAGSQAAAAQGRAAARLGGDAEQATLQALARIAGWLDGATAPATRHRAVGSLRTPRGFPAAAAGAKDEWDAAIVREGDAAGAEIVLLAEVKAAPAAATPDLLRLLRGLQRLAQASADGSYEFGSADGELRVSGASLRRLRPQGQALPPHVIYCCSAPAETRVAMLSSASKAVLLAEPASLAFARQVADGEAAPHATLAAVWEALTTTPRLHLALRQYDAGRTVREAMLHPDDLLSAVRSVIDGAR